jgi:hypothetical protein
MRTPFAVSPKARFILAALVAAAALAALSWIALAYLQPGLRKAIVYSGFGLC